MLDDSLALLAASYLQIAEKAKRRNLILLHTKKHGTMTRTAVKQAAEDLRWRLTR